VVTRLRAGKCLILIILEPVISSANIPTIPLAVAQAIRSIPRSPSLGSGATPKQFRDPKGTNVIANPQIESGGLERADTLQMRHSWDTTPLSGTALQSNSSSSSLAPEEPQIPVHKIVNSPRADSGISESQPQKAPSPNPPSEWMVEEVVDWLKSKGFDQHICDKFIGIAPKKS
jgi:hypothetical protein